MHTIDARFRETRAVNLFLVLQRALNATQPESDPKEICTERSLLYIFIVYDFTEKHSNVYGRADRQRRDGYNSTYIIRILIYIIYDYVILTVCDRLRAQYSTSVFTKQYVLDHNNIIHPLVV